MIDDVRAQFRAFDPVGLADYDPFPKGKGKVRKFGQGGLDDLVAVVNSVIGAVALAALVALFATDAVARAGAAGAGFVLCLAAQGTYLWHSYRRKPR